MKIDYNTKLDFSDVLIRPKRSELSSRSEVSLLRTMKFKHSKIVWRGIPIIVSNMDTTGTISMAKSLQKHKLITCLHKHYNYKDIPSSLDKNYYAVSTGISSKDLDNLKEIMENIDPIFICVDVANGYSSKLIAFCQNIRKLYPDKVIIAGNVVTREMVEELLINGGVDIVKCGIGSGSVCTTRLQTGVGYPQLSSILECSDAAHGINGHVISDGGIQVVGDIGKSFGAGADFVMCGSLFAGHTECSGDVTEENGLYYKTFYGMSSVKAMEKYHGGVASYRSAEGRCVKIPYKGDVEDTVKDILGGLRSTMTYIGAKELKHIPKCTSFIKVNNQINKIYVK